LFTAQFGAALPTGRGTQAVFDATGHVVAVGTRGGSILTRGSAVQAIGAPATWLQAHLTVGAITRVDSILRDDRTGQLQPLDPATSIVSAGPTLLRDGHPAVDAVTEGVLDPHDLSSYGFVCSEIRQPRTMAGIDASGRMLLGTVDGRGPGVSEGLTLTELATLARQLGAREAMNLDGGGSTAMAVNGKLITPPDAIGSAPTATRSSSSPNHVAGQDEHLSESKVYRVPPTGQPPRVKVSTRPGAGSKVNCGVTRSRR
jgi:hypothetical protein